MIYDHNLHGKPQWNKIFRGDARSVSGLYFQTRCAHISKEVVHSERKMHNVQIVLHTASNLLQGINDQRSAEGHATAMLVQQARARTRDVKFILNVVHETIPELKQGYMRVMRTLREKAQHEDLVFTFW